jgi:hypothetical protein
MDFTGLISGTPTAEGSFTLPAGNSFPASSLFWHTQALGHEAAFSKNLLASNSRPLIFQC